MTRPVLLSENSRSALMHECGSVPPRKAPQFIAAFVSTLSAVCLGMVFSWSSSALPIFEREFEITTTQGAWVGSLVTLGAFVGAIPAGPIAQLIGRKRTLQILIIPLLTSWMLIAFLCNYIWVLYIARFLAGIASGGISVAAPMYVSELAHVSIRGTLGTFFQVQITIGILLEYLLGDIISDIRTLSLLSAILPVVFLLSVAFIPESPVYLCEKAQLQEAQKSLLWFRGEDYEIEEELVKITEDIEESRRNKTRFFELFNSKATYKGLIISFGLMAFQQLSGVNAVLFYTNQIFQQSGGSLSPGQCSILVGAVQVIASLITTVLIDRAGRKILLTVSGLAMCLCLAALGFYFYFSNYVNLRVLSFVPVVSVTGFMASFSLGFGPIPWMIMGEILPPKSRGIVSSIAASINWLLAFLITNQFANAISLIGIGPTFLGFCLFCGLSSIFVLSLVEETKGRSQKEVAHLLAGKYQAVYYSEIFITRGPDITN